MRKRVSASAKRLAALEDLSRAWLTADGQLRDGVTKERVLLNIIALRPLGKTARWQKALDNWKSMVSVGPGDLNWAVLQGIINAGCAAL